MRRMCGCISRARHAVPTVTRGACASLQTWKKRLRGLSDDGKLVASSRMTSSLAVHCLSTRPEGLPSATVKRLSQLPSIAARESGGHGAEEPKTILAVDDNSMVTINFITL